MKRTQAHILEIHPVSPTVIELVLERDDRRPFFNFRPGQYATLSFPRNASIRGERSFSIASTPTDRSTLHFGIRIIGKYTTAVRELLPGEPVLVAGPYGDFSFNPARDKQAVFLAGGVGVTPFLSMIHAATEKNLSNDLVLLYSVRSLSDVPFAKELDVLERANPRFRVVYAVTDGDVPPRTTRIVPGRITPELIHWAANGEPIGRSYFLCGPPAFSSAMTKNLQHLGVETDDVRSERFAVGSTEFIERASPVPKFVFAAWGVAAVIVLGIVIRTEQTRRVSAEIPAVTSQSVNGSSSGSASQQNSNVNPRTDSTTIQPVDQSVVPSPVQPDITYPRMIVPRTGMS